MIMFLNKNWYFDRIKCLRMGLLNSSVKRTQVSLSANLLTSGIIRYFANTVKRNFIKFSEWMMNCLSALSKKAYNDNSSLFKWIVAGLQKGKAVTVWRRNINRR